MVRREAPWRHCPRPQRTAAARSEQRLRAEARRVAAVGSVMAGHNIWPRTARRIADVLHSLGSVERHRGCAASRGGAFVLGQICEQGGPSAPLAFRQAATGMASGTGMPAEPRVEGVAGARGLAFGETVTAAGAAAPVGAAAGVGSNAPPSAAAAESDEDSPGEPLPASGLGNLIAESCPRVNRGRLPVPADRPVLSARGKAERLSGLSPAQRLMRVCV